MCIVALLEWNVDDNYQRFGARIPSTRTMLLVMEKQQCRGRTETTRHKFTFSFYNSTTSGAARCCQNFVEYFFWLFKVSDGAERVAEIIGILLAFH